MEELRWGDRTLTDLYEEASVITLRDYPRMVIFSDLHLGDGSGRDDFVKNESLMNRVLENYYLEKDFALVLNGDIEELQKFRLSRIRDRYRDLYRIWDRFRDKKAFFKTLGNHDGLLDGPGGAGYPYPLHAALRVETGHRPLFIFHGHQAAPLYTHFNDLVTFLLRYLAAPLRIKNIPLKQSRKQYKIEKRVYRFSRRARVASLIGHTHRPLFESLSKADSLKFTVERLLRGYRGVAEGDKEAIAARIRKHKALLDQMARKKYPGELSILYSETVPVPCLFNGGCCIGKRGVTCLEIRDGRIALVHWYEEGQRKTWSSGDEKGGQLREDTGCVRQVIKEDSLDYISDCIDLLV